MYKNILKYNCYASKNLCNSISYNKNGSCDECYKKYGLITIENLLNNYISNIKNSIVSEIKILLEECDKSIGKELKSLFALKMINILSKNLYFFFDNKKFLVTFIKKCNEFSTEKNIFDTIVNLNPEYAFCRDFIFNVNKFYEDNIKYDMMDGDKILNDFDIFISDYMNNYIDNYINDKNKLNEIKTEDTIEKIKKEKIIYNYKYYDEIINLDI